MSHLTFFRAAALALLVANVSFAEEKEFETIFDGTDFSGWKQAGNWVLADDGSMFRKEKGGAIRYTAKKIPDDFELRFEWKVGERSNSGIYYRPTQYEYQILDNSKHPDGRNPRTSAASLYFCMPPSEDATKPVGEWNTGRIVAKGSVIQHWLNGKKVVAFDYKDPQWKFEVDLLAARGGNLEARGAHLSLQDHGDPVWYRNIQLREIPAGESIDATPVQPVTIPKPILDGEKKKLEGILERRKANESKKGA